MTTLIPEYITEHLKSLPTVCFTMVYELPCIMCRTLRKTLGGV